MVAKAKNPLWVKREVEPLRERTVKSLRDAILSNHLKPGQRLVERDLCEQSGVSRSSIREALRYLESEGLAESRGTKGMFVSVLNLKQALEIYEVRAALESEAARHFTERATATDIKAARQAFQTAERLLSGNAEVLSRAIDRFFEILFTGARNATAFSLVRMLRARINLLRHATTRVAPRDRLVGSMAQMKLIVEALERRDGAAAADACRRYVARSAEFARQLLEKQKELP
ncbi:MAG TPA: GntR family transcriptional regulator [Stellaceae bacterium]|nr:GntR family transcriptional regulator [Stellaceae bacterium]